MSPRIPRVTKKLAVMAAAVIIVVLAAVLAGCGSVHAQHQANVQAADNTSWYASGLKFGQETGKAGEGGQSAAIWCSNLAQGHAAVPGSGMPPQGSGSTATTAWLEGCTAGYSKAYTQAHQAASAPSPSQSSPASGDICSTDPEAAGCPFPSQPSSAPSGSCADQYQAWLGTQVDDLEGSVQGYNSDTARPDSTGAFRGYAAGDLSNIQQTLNELATTDNGGRAPSCADPAGDWGKFVGDLQNNAMAQAQADYQSLNAELAAEGYQAPVPSDPSGL